MGIGVSTYVEICAMGPSIALPAGGWESATVRIEPTGKVTVMTGISPHGQGEETSFAQIVGRRCSACDRRRAGGPRRHQRRAIRHRHLRQPRHRGRRHRAGLVRSEKIVAKAQTLAAHLLGTDEASLTFENGRFVGAPDDRSVTIQESGAGGLRPARTSRPISSRGWSRRTSSSRRTSPSPSARTSASSKSTRKPAM